MVLFYWSYCSGWNGVLVDNSIYCWGVPNGVLLPYNYRGEVYYDYPNDTSMDPEVDKEMGELLGYK